MTTPRLELVRAAGRQYAETGTVSAALLAEIGSPMTRRRPMPKS